MPEIWTVILAAGESKRMRSALPKVLHPLCGRPMLSYILDAAGALTNNLLVVIGHGAELVKNAMESRQVKFVLQEEQLGTGHAVQQTLDLLPDTGCLLVLYGDIPLIDRAHLEKLIRAHGQNAATVLTTVPPDPYGYGRIIRNESGTLQRIAEETDASSEEKLITEINTGICCFELSLLKRFLPLIKPRNVQGEYYLTDVISLLVDAGYTVGTCLLEDYRPVMGVNNREQLAEAAMELRRKINSALMREGVTLHDPYQTYIDSSVTIGPDTEIWPQTVLEGDTHIGSGCRLGPGVFLHNTRLGDEVTIRYSVLEDCVVEAGAKIGPFSYLRPGSHIGGGVKIGDFVEIKNARIGRGTKIPHLSYVGDVDIGDKVNIGAGVIVVNYDGRRKHRSTIEDGSFIGCNSNLISPVTIGAGAYIGAGSTITRDVPPGALALARSRQENRPDMAGRYLKQEKEQDSEKR